ncbi:hypothetical protein H4S08_002150 [Coemansia sp. RSA 1365]|nr:hypothetical protein H4S08_002150 [Coemansia sp. RSA 1365]
MTDHNGKVSVVDASEAIKSGIETLRRKGAIILEYTVEDAYFDSDGCQSDDSSRSDYPIPELQGQQEMAGDLASDLDGMIL